MVEENVLNESLVLWVRVTGAVPGVEKTISILVRSMGGVCDDPVPMVNLMVSIPVSGLEDNP
jgi:hypothetical protein